MNSLSKYMYQRVILLFFWYVTEPAFSSLFMKSILVQISFETQSLT